MNILERHRRLRELGEAILQGSAITNRDRRFLGTALINIGNGSDASGELESKSRRGEDAYEKARRRDIRDKLLFGWLEAAMAPEEDGGLGLTKKEAIKKLKNTRAGKVSFPISPETIDSYLRKYPEKRKQEFNLD